MPYKPELFTSRVSGRGHRIGAVCVCVCVCVSALSRLNRLTYDGLLSRSVFRHHGATSNLILYVCYHYQVNILVEWQDIWYFFVILNLPWAWYNSVNFGKSLVNLGLLYCPLIVLLSSQTDKHFPPSFILIKRHLTCPENDNTCINDFFLCLSWS